ncbi:Uncharacterised protein [Streptococcus pneumoniae]|nr:Uncharacterised protein [Streptococcus pneumoniae]
MKKYQLLFKISASFLLLIFRIWSFSDDAYYSKLLAIFFPDWQFRLDSKFLEFAI